MRRLSCQLDYTMEHRKGNQENKLGLYQNRCAGSTCVPGTGQNSLGSLVCHGIIPLIPRLSHSWAH